MDIKRSSEMKAIKILIIMFLLVGSVPITMAAPQPAPAETVQDDINATMAYVTKISTALSDGEMNYGVMTYMTLTRFIGVGAREPIFIALAAKLSGGSRYLMNGNYIGLFQICGFRPWALYNDSYGDPIDNRYYLTGPTRNTKFAVMKMDRIMEEIWEPVAFYHSDLELVAERFYCTPNHFEPIVYSCNGSAAWAADWYDNYLPAANAAWSAYVAP